MLLRIEFKTPEETRNRNAPGRWLIIKCDECGIEFKKNYHHALRDQKTHACSRACHGKLERKGSVRDSKKRQTSIENYGVDHPRKSKIVEEQRKKTSNDLYGGTGKGSPIIKEKIEKTCMIKYGSKNPFESVEIQKKIKDRLIERFGVDHPMKSNIIQTKIDWHAAWEKAHQTKKENGSYKKSMAENACFKRLSNIFPQIERQIIVKHDSGSWSIDFKIKETYIQFDGVYWHGLNRPIELIRSSATSRDKSIAKAYDNDRQQDKWFDKQGLKLIRITDKQIKWISDHDLKSIIT